MKKVYLMGTLGTKFGSEWEAECDTIAEIFQLIDCQTEGFRNYMINCVHNGTNFSIRAGKDIIQQEEELLLNINATDIYITDVPAGSDSAWGKIIAAVAIVAFIYFTGGFGTSATSGFGTWTSAGASGGLNLGGQILFAVALNLAISGINELLMPKPDKGSNENYFFNGPINTIKQGQPVPILYGRLIVGGAPISVTYTKRKITSAGFVYHSTDLSQGDFDAVSSLDPGILEA